MTDFHRWSLEAQKAFWLKLAHEVIGRWNLRVEGLSWLGYSHNAVFKVSAAAGDYVLRLQPSGRVKAAELRSELQWLRTIRRNTDLLAPFPRPAGADGKKTLLAAVDHPQLPQTVYGCLFEYAPGLTKSAAEMRLDDVFQIGVYLGRLHTAGQFRPPSDFSRPRLDWEGLFGERSPYHPGENAHVVQSQVFAQTAARVQAVMRGLGSGADELGLIHADLLAKNLLFHQGGAAALDFEYCGWGYYLYDLAPLLWQFKGERAADYERLEAALWSGYISIRPQADARRELLEAFIAGRQLASCRWLAANLHHPTVGAAAPTLLAQRQDELKGFLDSGKLRRWSRTL